MTTSPSESVEMVGGPHCGGAYYHYSEHSLPEYLPMPSAGTRLTHLYVLIETPNGKRRYVHVRIFKEGELTCDDDAK